MASSRRLEGSNPTQRAARMCNRWTCANSRLRPPSSVVRCSTRSAHSPTCCSDSPPVIGVVQVLKSARSAGSRWYSGLRIFRSPIRTGPPGIRPVGNRRVLRFRGHVTGCWTDPVEVVLCQPVCQASCVFTAPVGQGYISTSGMFGGAARPVLL